MPTMAISCLKARIEDGITDREMVDGMSLLGCEIEITLHLLILERADPGCSHPKRLAARQVVTGRADTPSIRVNVLS